MIQPDLFTTYAPINQVRLATQNGRLFNYLMEGGSIHVLHPMKLALRIGYLNSRIADLIKLQVEIQKDYIKAMDARGELLDVVQYRMTREQIAYNRGIVTVI